jgi:hypothetical protein
VKREEDIEAEEAEEDNAANNIEPLHHFTYVAPFVITTLIINCTPIACDK